MRDYRLLLQKHRDVYALPGGHVNFGETSEKTLVREFKEELGVDILCGRLIWVEENFWKWGSRKAHGISFYYIVSLKNNADISDDFARASKDNADVSLQWISFEDMKGITIYPEFVKDRIGNISEGIEHFVRNSW